MTDTPIGRILQSIGHLFEGSLGRHAPVQINPGSGVVSGGKEGHTGQQYGLDPFTGKPIWNADPAGNYIGGSGYGRTAGYGGGEGGGGASGGFTAGYSNGDPGIGGLFGMPGGRIEQFILNRLT